MGHPTQHGFQAIGEMTQTPFSGQNFNFITDNMLHTITYYLLIQL